MSPATNKVLSPLQDLLHEGFAQVLISPDDAVSDAGFHKFWAPDVKEE